MMAARNIQRIEINIHEKLCVIYNDSEYNFTVFVTTYVFIFNRWRQHEVCVNT